ncbi:DUF3995 domain-containing protein [Persicitalea sp.]|uniref:DUF3995 domain-containing protein n=1 Tax=Persicitalea sp. TaxID=3100273 RepID=UPI0035946B84
MIALSIFLSVIFFTLGLLHLYWATGGQWGIASTLPTNASGYRILNPRKADSAVVGLGLISFGLFYLFKMGLIPNPLPDWLFRYGGWLIPAIFILRAVGDFKYVGFFKKIKQTSFGKIDTQFYSPLCLGVGFIALLLQVVN